MDNNNNINNNNSLNETEEVNLVQTTEEFNKIVPYLNIIYGFFDGAPNRPNIEGFIQFIKSEKIERNEIFKNAQEKLLNSIPKNYNFSTQYLCERISRIRDSA